ncbi:unnamed protein product [Malus baccata var. baccata]
MDATQAKIGAWAINPQTRKLSIHSLFKYIYGGHVAAYMRTLVEDEPEKCHSHFSEYIKKGIEADNIKELYKKVHVAIVVDPTIKKTEKLAPKKRKKYNLKKLTFDERKKKLVERLKAFNDLATMTIVIVMMSTKHLMGFVL